ncbi:MAG TPA: YetF domain-containing protein [Anaerolineaceae bacterium]|jgi:uncharacterized membrane protein YcaP (DUF421 family)
MDTILSNMFQIGLPLILEKVLRTMLVYSALIVGLRLAGKREMAQLNPFDLVVLLTISNTVQNAIIGNDNSVSGGIIGVAALLLINYLVVRFVYSNDKIEKLVEGSEDTLIEQGILQEKVMKREMITFSELEIAAHKQGINSLNEVERAVLEPDGGITFSSKIPNPEERRHQELVARLDSLAKEVTALRVELAKNQGS